MISRCRAGLVSMLTLLLVIPCTLTATGQEQEPKQEQKKKPEKKEKKPRASLVLFIGGSRTRDNNLPDIFAKMAQAGGAGLVETGMVASSGWSFKDHWQRGDAHRVLRDKNWKFVILQDESPGGLAAGIATADDFRPFARNWAQSVQDVGAVPVFFLTWARRDAPEEQGSLNRAYFGVAKETEAKVAPVGIAWAQVRERHPEIGLYAEDGSRPSPAGSYLAGCVIYAAAFNRNPEGLPARIAGRPVNPETGQVESENPQVLVDLPADRAKILQQAAWAAKKLLDKNHGYLEASAAPAR